MQAGGDIGRTDPSRPDTGKADAAVLFTEAGEHGTDCADFHNSNLSDDKSGGILRKSKKTCINRKNWTYTRMKPGRRYSGFLPGFVMFNKVTRIFSRLIKYNKIILFIDKESQFPICRKMSYYVVNKYL